MDIASPKVLLLEDSPVDAALLKKILTRTDGLNWDVIHIETLGEALQHLKHQTPDLMLTDLSLPDAQGLETVVKIHAFAPNVPIVVLTAHDDESLGLEAVRRGAQDYLAKGAVSYSLLTKTLRYAMERSHTQQIMRQQLAAMSASREGIAILDERQVFTYVNSAFVEIHDCESSSSLLGHPWKILHNPLEAQRLMREIEPAIQQHGYWCGESIGKRQNGEECHREISLTVLAEGGFIYTVRDVTQRKQAEAALNQSRRQYQIVAETSPVGLFHTSVRGNCFYANERWYEITGLTPKEALEDGWIKAIHPDDKDWVFTEWCKAITTSSDFRAEFRFLRPDSTASWVYAQAVRDMEAGTIARQYIGTFTDITDLKETSEALRQSETRFQKLVKNMPGMIYQYVLHGDGSDSFTYVSPSCSEIYEIEADVMRQNSNTLMESTHPSDRALIRESLLSSAASLHPWYQEYRIKTPSGQLKWLQGIARPEQQPNGDIVWDGVVIDISDRKHAEDQARQGEEKFRQLAENIREAFFISNLDYSHYFYISPGYEQIWGCSCETLYENPATWMELIHPDDRDRIAETILKPLDKSYNQEYRIIRPDGEIRWVNVRAFPIRNPQGETYRIAGISEDITEKKQAEEHLKASLEEKSVLLKEIHHRVKNNLQTISSLLRLQLATIQDLDMQERFQESQNRVHAMALVHEKLYQSASLSRVNFADYVCNLVTDLIESYATNPQLIRVSVNIAEAELEADTVIPCGLIINELVSNALKYAFPDQSAGEISIQFVQENSEHYALSVKDSGIGMPKDFDFYETKSLGLKLVRLLTKQLRGEVELSVDNGTTFTIRFASSFLSKKT